MLSIVSDTTDRRGAELHIGLIAEGVRGRARRRRGWMCRATARAGERSMDGVLDIAETEMLALVVGRDYAQVVQHLPLLSIQDLR